MELRPQPPRLVRLRMLFVEHLPVQGAPPTPAGAAARPAPAVSAGAGGQEWATVSSSEATWCAPPHRGYRPPPQAPSSARAGRPPLRGQLRAARAQARAYQGTRRRCSTWRSPPSGPPRTTSGETRRAAPPAHRPRASSPRPRPDLAPTLARPRPDLASPRPDLAPTSPHLASPRPDLAPTSPHLATTLARPRPDLARPRPDSARSRPISADLGRPRSCAPRCLNVVACGLLAVDVCGEVRYDDTLAHATRALEADPSNVKALFRRGQAHLRRPRHINGLALALEVPPPPPSEPLPAASFSSSRWRLLSLLTDGGRTCAARPNSSRATRPCGACWHAPVRSRRRSTTAKPPCSGGCCNLLVTVCPVGRGSRSVVTITLQCKLGSTTPSWSYVVPPVVVLFRPGSDMAPSATRARTPAIRGTPGAVGGGCRHSSCAG